MFNHEKSTEELVNEIKHTDEIQKFLEKNNEEFSAAPLHEYFCGLIASKGMKKSDVVRGGGLNRVYAYQILSGKRLPSRDKLLALCFGLHLDLNETNEVMKYAGFSQLFARNKRDAIIIFAINNEKSVFAADELLYDNGFNILTA